jgi:DNA-binding transcriptional LysR family regulator
MNLRQLRSLNAIMQHGSFAAAADHLGLSHAAVSIQMQQLEEFLGAELFNRQNRPVELTQHGIRIADSASEVLEKLETLRQLASGQKIAGSITIGFIPTCVHHLLPPVLTAIREQFPDLQGKVKSGLSGELSAAVMRRELDYALLTSPPGGIPELNVTDIASEPLYVIGPISQTGMQSDEELVRSMPFIAFNKRTWVGQQIAARLQQRGIYLNEAIEIDSLEAIENLVVSGFGVSILPRRLHAGIDLTKLVQIPFCDPVETRKLALIQHRDSKNSSIDDAIRNIFIALPEHNPDS